MFRAATAFRIANAAATDDAKGGTEGLPFPIDSGREISKHLAFLRERELLGVERDQNWMTYLLPQKRAPELQTNLKCIQDCVQSDKVFARDLKKLDRQPKDSLVALDCPR